MTYESKYKDALDAINSGVLDLVDIKPYIPAIKKALAKQIPQKPTHEATLYKCFTCPSCKNVIDEYIDFGGKKVRVCNRLCKFCGQAIDWEEE